VIGQMESFHFFEFTCSTAFLSKWLHIWIFKHYKYIGDNLHNKKCKKKKKRKQKQ
jgi:hypothetical protein